MSPFEKFFNLAGIDPRLVKARWDAGASPEEIASFYGIPTGTVAAYLEEVERERRRYRVSRSRPDMLIQESLQVEVRRAGEGQ